MANSRSGESVVERVLRILDAFDVRNSVLTLSALSRRADLPLTTVHRLVAEMTRLGVLDRSGDGRVRVGMRMWELSFRSSSALRLREAAIPVMHEVQRRVMQHTNLAVLSDGDVLYIESLAAPRATKNIGRITARLPLHACSSGLTFMAHASDETREAFVRSSHLRITDHTLIDEPSLRRALAAIRKSGHCVAAENITLGSTGIAAPIFDADGEVIAALNVVIASTMPVAPVVAIVEQAASEISGLLSSGMRPRAKRVAPHATS